MIYPLILIILFLCFPSAVTASCYDALTLCIKSVIPSLFPFCVISSLILKLSLCKKSKFINIISRTLHLSYYETVALICGILCGYPIGAKSVSSLLESKKTDVNRAKKLLLIVNHPSPAFTLSTVGGIFLNNVAYGIIIYLSSVFSGLIPLFFIRGNKKKDDIISSSVNFPLIFTESLSDSVLSILNISGIIIFFSAVKAIIEIFLLKAPDILKNILIGFMEMTSGIKLLSTTTQNIYIIIPFSAFFLTFGGMSVLFQIKTFMPKVRLIPLAAIRFLSGISAALFSIILIFFYIKLGY